MKHKTCPTVENKDTIALTVEKPKITLEGVIACIGFEK